MTDITIPPAALEAACEAYEAAWDVEHSEPDDWFRAAIAAALNAWPGMEVHNFDGWTHAEGLVLPLPQEITLNAQNINALAAKSAGEEITLTEQENSDE